MRYVCPICGYIYDEAIEGTPFDSLPDSWSCPLCGAPKLMFGPEEAPQPAQDVQPAPALEEDDLQLLPCRGLVRPVLQPGPGAARNNTKTRRPPCSARSQITLRRRRPPCPTRTRRCWPVCSRRTWNRVTRRSHAAARDHADRGTQRVCVWGEKVTQMLYALLGRYQREGEAFLEGTQVWVCSVCGFIYIGDAPPELCPVCKVPAWKFDKMEGRRPA